MTSVPLRRNRDFLLLQAGQLLSNSGTESTSIAYPLLVLAVTGSAARAGVVSFARTLPSALLALPAGVLADRRNRRRLMIAADGVRVLAIGSLAAAILAHQVAFWAIPLVAFVEGSGTVLFLAAHAGAVRAVVPARQLPAAAGAQSGRQAAVGLIGPPLGAPCWGCRRRCRSWSTPPPTPARRSRCWRCGRRSSRPASRTGRRCARGSPRGSASSGGTRSCAPAPCCSAWRTSSAPASCSPWWWSAGGRG